MKDLFLILQICVLFCSNGNVLTTTKATPHISVAVEPKSQTPVGSLVIVHCRGPLNNGAALVFDGNGKKQNGKAVVSFKMIKADGGTPKIQKHGKQVDRFTIFLDDDRQGVNIQFRMKFSDNGYYRCGYLDSDTNSIKMQTDAIMIKSFYPPDEPELEYHERLKNNGSYVMDITCKAYVGYPSGNLTLNVEGIDLNVDAPIKEAAIGKKGNIWKVKASISAKISLNGTEVKCVSGGDQNPRMQNVSQILNVQVPITQAVIKGRGVVFRTGGSRVVCEAIGNPPPTYSWILNGEPMNTSNPSIDAPKEAGIYSVTCQATNEVLSKIFSSQDHYIFGVVPKTIPCSNSGNGGENHSKKQYSEHVAFITATVLAVVFTSVALLMVIILINMKRKSGYDKM